MTRILIALAAFASVFSFDSAAEAQMVARQWGNRLEIYSGAPGTERFEVHQSIHNFVYLVYDNEVDNDDDLEFWNSWTGIETIYFYGDDDRDEFSNLTNLKSYQSGGPGDDFLIGGSNDDRLYGDLGKDSLWGLAGDDWLDAGIDIDEGFVYGDAGDDVLIHHKYGLGRKPFKVIDSSSGLQIVVEQRFQGVDLGTAREPHAMDEIRRPVVNVLSTEYREMVQYSNQP